MKLVSDWKRAHRWFSIHAMVLAGAVQAAWVAIPDDLHTSVPAWVPHVLTGVLLIAGIAGRLVDQSPTTDPNPTVPSAP